jgi:hypothetical protein
MTRCLPALCLLLTTAACDRLPTQEEYPARAYEVGEVVPINAGLDADSLCAEQAPRSARIMHVSEYAIVAEDLANPAGGFSGDEYAQIAGRFDEEIWPTITENFGSPSDLDQNARVILFFTRAINDLTPPGEDWYVGGAFASRDLFPRTRNSRLGGCAGSNEAEVIYLLAPDPGGEVGGNVRTKGQHLHRTLAVVAHEMQHLINASRRLHAGGSPSPSWSEEPWLNEGLSQIAEELVGFSSSALEAGHRIDMAALMEAPGGERAMSDYLNENFSNLAHFLARTDTTALFGADGFATRGASWSFLRYAADRQTRVESDFWGALLPRKGSGLSNLSRAASADIHEWVHDWLVSLYAERIAERVQPRYRQQTWDFAHLYPRLRTPSGGVYGVYPLVVTPLGPSAPRNVTVRTGSAAYLEFSTAAAGLVEVRGGAVATAASCANSTRTIEVGQVVWASLGSSGARLCLENTEAGSTFGVIITSTVPSGAAQIRVEARGGVSAATNRDPVHAQHAADPRTEALEWERSLRRREEAELLPLTPGPPVARYASPSTLGNTRIAVIRLR